MLKRIAGVVAILFGVALGTWVVYAVFVSEDPDDKIRRPGRAIGFAVAAIGLGVYWVRGAATAEKAEVPAEQG